MCSFLNSRLMKRLISSSTGLRSPRSRTCMRSSWSRVLSPKFRKYTIGSGSFSTRGLSRAALSSNSRTRSRSEP
ncbi:hypothetical protein D3C76_1689510 [compost metagenome]